jgi:protein-tyrosine phosphatase
MSLIIPDLYLCSQFEASSFCNNKTANIIINAAIEVHHPIVSNMTVLNLNWDDIPSQNININNTLFRMIDIIDSYLTNNQKVVVNCFAGVSRSSSIVIAYIMYKYNLTLEEAFQYVKSKRPIVQPNVGFMRQLKGLEPLLLTYKKA